MVRNLPIVSAPPVSASPRVPTRLIASAVRDLKVAEELRALAWEVFTIWECRTHPPELLADLLERYFGELLNKSDGT